MTRLDAELVARGLVSSRSRAQRLIREGAVRVDGRTASKPSLSVGEGSSIDVDLGDDYASRGALKLVGAFGAFGQRGLASPEGLDCLDIGASTGGFTDVLLRRGARRVIALDVGHGQLVPRIAGDSRVVEMSGVNIRDVSVDDLPFRPRMVVSDVSFISLTYVIPVIAEVAAPEAEVVVLVKPQFEVGRDHLGRNGIVVDDDARDAAVARVLECVTDHGCRLMGITPSPITGTHGNVEYLAWFRTPSAARTLRDEGPVSR